MFSQSEYQIINIPENSLLLSTNDSFPSNLDYFENDNYSISYLQYPADINFLNFKYQKYSFSFLNFGLIEDSIDNNVINSFNSYEYYLKYKISKFDKYLSTSIGFVYSKIENYTSNALLINFEKIIESNNFNLNFSLENLAIVLKPYTVRESINQYKLQLGLNNISIKSFYFGYDLVYNNFTSSPIHIFSLSKNISKFFKFRLSSSTHFKNLKLYDNFKDYLYGVSVGFTLFTNTNKRVDISFLNLGPSGYVYGITLNL